MGETMSREQAAAKLAAMMADRLSVHPTMPRSEATRAALSGVTEKAIELIQEADALRAQLTEKDREIERLKAELGSDGWEVHSLRLEAVECQLSASRAREREAVTALAEARERAEKAEARIQELSQEPYATDRTRAVLYGEKIDELNTALADARKALEKWREIAINMHAHRDYVRSLDDAGLTEALRATERFDPHLAALYRAMLEDRAALNGDSHG